MSEIKMSEIKMSEINKIEVGGDIFYTNDFLIIIAAQYIIVVGGKLGCPDEQFKKSPKM
jgi:hypothetical protein